MIPQVILMIFPNLDPRKTDDNEFKIKGFMTVEFFFTNINPKNKFAKSMRLPTIFVRRFDT